VPVVDCVLLNKGRLVRWICTGEEGEATEKLSTDREALFRVFKKCSELLGHFNDFSFFSEGLAQWASGRAGAV